MIRCRCSLHRLKVTLWMSTHKKRLRGAEIKALRPKPSTFSCHLPQSFCLGLSSLYFAERCLFFFKTRRRSSWGRIFFKLQMARVHFFFFFLLWARIRSNSWLLNPSRGSARAWAETTRVFEMSNRWCVRGLNCCKSSLATVKSNTWKQHNYVKSDKVRRIVRDKRAFICSY